MAHITVKNIDSGLSREGLAGQIHLNGNGSYYKNYAGVVTDIIPAPANACVSARVNSDDNLTTEQVLEIIAEFKAAAKEAGISNPDFAVYSQDSLNIIPLIGTNGGKENHVQIPSGTKGIIIKMEFGSRQDIGRANAVRANLEKRLKAFTPKEKVPA